MAGIGFTLRNLARSDRPFGSTRAYSYATFLVAGPWLFTVLALAGVSFSVTSDTSWAQLQNFRSVIIYNFCLSLILTGPVVLLLTRYVADQIFSRDKRRVMFSLVCSLACVGALTCLAAAPLYILGTTLDPAVRLFAVFNFGLISAIWIVVPYVSILKNYRSVTNAFGLGAASAIAMTLLFSSYLDDAALLVVFNFSLSVILFFVVRCILREYPAELHFDTEWRVFLRTRWEVAGIGLLYYLGIWADKLIMWFSGHEGTIVVGGLLYTLPAYDSAMFKAQLLAIPAFVVFFVHIETGFYSSFRKLYSSFENHATQSDIDAQIHKLGNFILSHLFYVMLFLCLISAAIIMALPLIYQHIGVVAMQIGIFRTGLIGTALHTTFLFCIIFLLYFDLRKLVLMLTAAFFVLNVVFTTALLPMGLSYMGFGYLLAGAVSLALAVTVLLRELPWLTFHAFVTNNDSLRDSV